MDKPRFVLAIVISAAILFGWTILFPVKPPQPQSNANANSSPTDQKASPTPTASESPTSGQANQTAQATGGEVPADATAQRKIKVTTPLYDVTLDSRGAVATSWILKKNKDNENPLYSVDSVTGQPKPLELIPQDRINQPDPREAPLLLQTADKEKTAESK